MGDQEGNLDLGYDEPEDLSTSRVPADVLVLAPSKPPIDIWPPRLPMEVALCSTYEEEIAVCEKYGVTEAQYSQISSMDTFRRAVSESIITLREDGYTFKHKCRAIAEDFLGNLDSSLHNPEVGLSTKLDIFKTVTKLGELEPKPSKATDVNSNQNQVNIQIIL
jgi:hypothetical protein